MKTDSSSFIIDDNYLKKFLIYIFIIYIIYLWYLIFNI